MASGERQLLVRLDGQVALTTGGHAAKTYAVMGPRAVSLADAAGLLSRQLGRQIRHERLAPGDVPDRFLGMGADPWLAGDAATLDSLLAAGHDEPVTDDLRKLTGRPPRTLEAFAAGVRGRLRRQRER